jgi:hypothetical protein
MKSLQRLLIATAIVVFVTSIAAPQDPQQRLAHANGQGMLKVGQERFKITSVVVKLIDDHTAELTLVSDITVFLSGTWSQQANSEQDFDLKITGGASGGGIEGGGKLTLGKDLQSSLRLDLKGSSKTTKRQIEVHFEGK